MMSPQCRKGGHGLHSNNPHPSLEPLEQRLLLDGTAPYFVTPLEDSYSAAGSSIAINIAWGDDDGPLDAVSLTVQSQTDGVTVTVPDGLLFAQLRFIQGDGHRTPIGNIVVDLFENYAPWTVLRFATLSLNHVNEDGSLDLNGVPFYTDVPVHRVITDFMIQTGDAENGDGTGGSPLPDLDNEIHSDLDFSQPGMLAMANSGPNTNNSQFFITDAPTTWLDGDYTIFGKMLAGQDVLTAVIDSPRYESNDRPVWLPLLEGVDVLGEAMVVQAENGFVGDATVSVKLEDSYGNVYEKDITVALGQAQTPAPAEAAFIRSGEPMKFVVNLAGLDNPQVSADLSDATVSLDASTGVVTLETPELFTGTVNVRLTADGGFARVYPFISQLPFGPQTAANIAARFGGINSTLRVGDHLFIGGNVDDDGNDLTEDFSVLEVYDVSDLSKPMFESSLAGTFSNITDMEVAGNTLYVLHTNLDTDNPRSFITAVDISDPANPVVMSDPVNPQENLEAATSGIPFSLEIAGNTALVADGEGGLSVYSLASDAITRLTTVANIPGATITNAREVTVAGDYAYVSAAIDIGGYVQSHVLVFNIANPANPQFVLNIPAHDALGVDVEGGLLYVADQIGIVSMYNVANPAAPKFVSSVQLSPQPQEVHAEGDYAVVSTGSAYVLLDMTDPKRPLPAYFFDRPTGVTASLIDGVVYGASGADGVVMVDTNQTVWVQAVSTIVDENGVPVTFSISSGAVARITLDGQRSGRIKAVELFGPTNQTLKITTPAGTFTTVEYFLMRGSAGGILAETTDLAGELDCRANLGKLVLHDVSDSRIGANTSGTQLGPQMALAMTFNDLSDVQIDTGGLPVTSLFVNSWTDGDGIQDNDSLTAPRMGKLKAQGDFAANLDINGTGYTTALGSAKIGGNLTSTLWNLSADVGTIVVLGSLSGETISVDGGMTALIVGSCQDGSYSVVAKSLKRLLSKGDFTPDVVLTGSSDKFAMRSAKVLGNLTSKTWQVAGQIGTINVLGTLGSAEGSGMVISGLLRALVVGGSNSDTYTVQAGGIRRLLSKGDFAANLKLTGGTGERFTLKNAVIQGDLTANRWDVAGAVKRVFVKRAAMGLHMDATGDILVLNVGAAFDSDFLAGFDSTFSKEAEGIYHFDFLNSYYRNPYYPPIINRVVIRGWRTPAPGADPYFVDNSNFIAANIGKVRLFNIDKTNSGIYACLGAGLGKEVRSVTHKSTTTPPFVGSIDQVIYIV